MVGRRALFSVKRDGKVGGRALFAVKRERKVGRRALFTVRLDGNVGKRAVRGGGADRIARRRAPLDGFGALRGRKGTFPASSASPTGVLATTRGVRSTAATENGAVTSEKATMLEIPARFTARKGGPITHPSSLLSDKARFVTQPAPFPARRGRLPAQPRRPHGPTASLIDSNRSLEGCRMRSSGCEGRPPPGRRPPSSTRGDCPGRGMRPRRPARPSRAAETACSRRT